ncbi:MAG: Bax inhibitor-1/YccA family protein [Gammaproteobacteria bacterium]|nr:Bax inhibitor-1/YccA family protein [Gammaproteobacteria bacterium]
MPTNYAATRPETAILATNKLIRNTYTLLSMTLLFSALTATLSVFMQVGYGASLFCTFGALGILWLVLPKTANSAAGIGVVFLFTGLLGFGLGPTIGHYLSVPGGSQIVMTALGGTGVIFLGLSGYALTTRRDFSFMGGFLFMGLLVILGAALANIFFAIPALSLALSAGIVMLFSGFILYDTGRMVNGGETNYIHATVSLYISILNIFTSLLHLLGAFGGDD